jgi:branched-chain amino acid transport system permease protein
MFDIPGFVWLQSIVNGLVLGWVYILMALGLSLILSITRILQFSHGEVYMLGAYVAYYFSVVLGLNFILSIFLSVFLLVVLGLLLERFLFRPLHGEFLPSMVVALGLMIIIQSSVTIGFGLVPKSIPSFAPGSFGILGTKIGMDRVIVVGISIAFTLLLFLFVKKSKYGLALAAAPQHREASILQGISPNAMSALALGGMGSLLGVVVGGLIMGLVDGVVLVIFGSVAASVVPLVLVIVILIFKPSGLFGHEF